MRCRHHILQLKQLVAGRGLHFEHIECRTCHVAGLQRVIQRILDDKSAARAVDDAHALLALRQRGRIDDAAGLVGQRRVQRDEVGAAEDVVTLHLLHTDLDGAFGAEEWVEGLSYPNTTTVLSHCLSTKNVDNVAAILSKRKNIVCEVSSLGAVHVNRLNIPRSPHAYDSGGLYANWIKFIEANPDQVLLGSDPCCGIDAAYSEIITELRTKVLPYLSPATIEKVANQNAVRIFSLKSD